MKIKTDTQAPEMLAKSQNEIMFYRNVRAAAGVRVTNYVRSGNNSDRVAISRTPSTCKNTKFIDAFVWLEKKTLILRSTHRICEDKLKKQSTGKAK